jgi:AraC-like DNA-binding protein
VRLIESATPRPELREFVRVYAHREIPCNGVGTTQDNIATLEQPLAFYLRGRTFFDYPDGQSQLSPKVAAFGSTTYPRGGAHFSDDVLGFAIFFKPLGLRQLFGIPPHVLLDNDCDAVNLLGKEIEDLWSVLAECTTFLERVRAAENYLLPIARYAVARTSIMHTAHHIFRVRGILRIDKLADQAGLSLRHYERRFSDEMGLSPKLFARITRFQRALDAKRNCPARPWLGIAHEFGYFDQTHMIKNFRSLGGAAPGEILKQSGDLQPWSLGSLVAPPDSPLSSKRHLF